LCSSFSKRIIINKYKGGLGPKQKRKEKKNTREVPDKEQRKYKIEDNHQNVRT